MDSVPSYEFHKIFRRVSYDVNLKGAFTPENIEKRLENAQEGFQSEAKRASTKTGRKRLRKKAKALENLQETNFAEKAIVEAIANPYGIVSLTLHYGRRKAEEMKLAFERARIRRRGIQRRRVR